MNIDSNITSIDFESKVSSKTGKTFKIWSCTLEDGTVLKMGFNKPKYVVGQRIVGTATVNRFGDVEFSAGGPETKPPAGGAPSRATTAAGRTFPVSKTSPEMSIIRQNSLTNANTVMKTLMQNVEFSKLGLLDGAGVFDVDKFSEMLMNYAYMFTDFSSGQREAKMVKAMTSDE